LLEDETDATISAVLRTFEWILLVPVAIKFDVRHGGYFALWDKIFLFMGRVELIYLNHRSNIVGRVASCVAIRAGVFNNFKRM